MIASLSRKTKPFDRLKYLDSHRLNDDLIQWKHHNLSPETSPELEWLEDQMDAKILQTQEKNAKVSRLEFVG